MHINKCILDFSNYIYFFNGLRIFLNLNYDIRNLVELYFIEFLIMKLIKDTIFVKEIHFCIVYSWSLILLTLISFYDNLV